MSTQFYVSVLTVAITLKVMLLACAYLILLERKMCAWIQNRIGPNRTGLSLGILPLRFHFWGLGQPLADGVKLLFKEDYTPLNVDRPLFIAAPIIVMIPAMLGWAVVPWGGLWQSEGWMWPTWIPFIGGGSVEPFNVSVTGAAINIGILYILAIGSLAVYGIVLGGYASNNKYSFFGSLRATAQMISYEIPQGLCVLIMILMWSTSRADFLVILQANSTWNLFYHPLLAIIFFTCVLAECNRAPFDLAEAEQELVGGYHTEYASMKWALFFFGEYMHMITGSAFFALLFLGGWDLPLVHEPAVGGLAWVALKITVFAIKTFLLVAVMIWIRWTLPRLRFDQLMRLAWRGLIPVTLAMLLITSAFVYFGIENWIYYCVANVIIFFTASLISQVVPTGAPVNRRVPLAGSRFSPAET